MATGTPAQYSSAVGLESDSASPTTYQWTGADQTWLRPCRYLRAGGAGVIAYKDADNNTKLAAFIAGETRAIVSQGIVLAGTTATIVEAGV